MQVVIALFLGLFIMSCSPLTAQPENNRPQTVHSIVKVQYEYDWYKTQYQLWKTALEQEPNNPAGWLNYYTAARMAKILSPDQTTREDWLKKMDAVVEAMKTPIKDSYEYHFIQGYHELDHLKQMPHIFKAYELDPERVDVYDDLVAYYELTRDKENMQKFAKKWKASGDHSPNLLLWNYNMLVSTAPNSILLTHGDNDTYPAWILQQAEDVRTDVTVINVHLLQRPEYRKLLFQELGIPLLASAPETSKEVVAHIIKHRGDHPLYTSLTIDPDKWGIADKLFNVGMALHYCESNEQTLSYLVSNYENNLLLDHLKCSVYTEEYPHAFDWCAKLYVPSLMMLHQHYALTNNQREQQQLKMLILRISRDWSEHQDIAKKLTEQEQSLQH